MKQRIQIFAMIQKARFLIGLLAMFLLIGCGQSLPENKYLGKIPAKAREHSEERERLVESQANARNMDEHQKIREKISELDKKWPEWIEEYVSSGGLQPTIPFEVEGEFPYTVNEVSLGLNRSIIELNFSLTLNQAFRVQIPRQRITLYFVGLDSNNEPIVISALPAGQHEVREALAEGSELILKGIWNRDHLRFLEDLAKVKIVTGEQYHELDRAKSQFRRRR